MYELIVIGGGPAGLAAACRAWDEGLRRILVIERDRELGGILNQCIHNGFGLQRFKEELTGPEYAGRFITMLQKTGVQVQLDTMALQIVPGRDGAPHQVHAINGQEGYQVLETRAVILAMGCRERTRGAISIPGERPAGIFTAGAAQRYLNIEGYMVGRRVVILGSGDIGLIMARRMTLEGAKVLACVELMPYSSGLTRNIVQCLQDYDIPLYLSHTITDIRGHNRVEQVTVSEVGPDRRPIPGTEMVFDCDTVLLSVGLIPENELTKGAGIAMDPRTSGAQVYENMETSIPGIFACGNVLHVHDLVDYVSAESERAGAQQVGDDDLPGFHRGGQADFGGLLHGGQEQALGNGPVGPHRQAAVHASCYLDGGGQHTGGVLQLGAAVLGAPGAAVAGDGIAVVLIHRQAAAAGTDNADKFFHCGTSSMRMVSGDEALCSAAAGRAICSISPGAR